MRTWYGHRWPRRATSYDGALTRTEKGVLVVGVDEASDWLRLDDGTEPVIVERSIQAVQDQLEPPSGWLGRALTTASFQLTLPYFADRIVLPAPPFQSLTAFEYLNTEGSRIEVDSDLYRIVESVPAEIVLARNKEWPSDVDCTQPDAVRVEYTAGYGGNAGDVPDVIRQWILYQVSMIYDIRSPVIVGDSPSETPFIRNMLETYRVKL